MKNYAIFCTAAENNSQYYLQRVQQWYDYYYPVYGNDTDFYVFIDGKINELPTLDGCKFMCLEPKLGRSSISKFEGYKRSFLEALKLLKDYDHLMLVENDVKILNFDNINEYREKPGLFSSIDERYHFIETAMMILNNKADVQKMIEHFELAVFSNELFEYWIQNNCKFKYPFKSIRVEGHHVNESIYDFLAQTSMTHFPEVY